MLWTGSVIAASEGVRELVDRVSQQDEESDGSHCEECGDHHHTPGMIWPVRA